MRWWAWIYLLMLPLIPWGTALAVSTDSPWWTHITYVWAHAGILHYCLNGLCWVMMRNIITPARTITAIAIASLIPAGDLPVLGWSAILYYYMGLCIATMHPSSRVRLMLLVALGFFMPWIAAGHHALMLAAGWLIRKVEVKWLRTLR